MWLEAKLGTDTEPILVCTNKGTNGTWFKRGRDGDIVSSTSVSPLVVRAGDSIFLRNPFADFKCYKIFFHSITFTN